MKRPAISGIVLAGGLARRMGGIDKGLQLLHGRPMVAQVVERLRPQVDELLINANRHADEYALFGPVIGDVVDGFAGPLAGLHAGMHHAHHHWIVTVPCDSPGLPTDLVERLWAGVESASTDLAIATTGEQMHPVFCLCRRNLRSDLEAQLRGGLRRFERWCQSLPHALVDFADQAGAFHNLNTLDELAAYDATSAKPSP